MDSLKAWKRRAGRKPLILRGARQTGKSWLLRRFAEECYENAVIVSLDADRRAARAFEPDLDPRRIARELAELRRERFTPGKTLLVLDEVQDCPAALRSLKYFCEDAPEYDVACAGSFLGIALHAGTSFPVGKAEFLELFPLTFQEFLLAVGEDALSARLDDWDEAAFRLYEDDYARRMRQYMLVGGMPEAVQAFADTGEYAEAERALQGIADMIDQDFSKHAPAAHVPRVRALWDTIPAQLGRENKKFKYSELGKGARAREYETAMLWLLDTGVAHKACRVSTARHPLKAYADEGAFKLYCLDVGLLARMAGVDAAALLDGAAPFVEFKGALAEQFAMQELIGSAGVRPYYWSNGSGQAEVDFLIPRGAHAIPLEVKSGGSLRAKSLGVYVGKFAPPIALRASLAAPRAAGGPIADIPLYAIGALPRLFQKLGLA
jgi:predicted AAA+ superfamily ATPase